VTENDEINEKYNLTKQRKFEFNYVNTENEKPSLPCPVDGCICGTFSRIFDKHLPETRNRMLSRLMAINANNNKISW